MFPAQNSQFCHICFNQFISCWICLRLFLFHFQLFPSRQNFTIITATLIPWSKVDGNTPIVYMLRKSEGCATSTLICSHVLVGIRAEAMLEAGMRLAPGERQSGDGTSLPETPNNLTNVCNPVPRPSGTKYHLQMHQARSLTLNLFCALSHYPSCQQCTLSWRTCIQPRGPSLWRVVPHQPLRVFWIWSLPHAHPPPQYMQTQVAKNIHSFKLIGTWIISYKYTQNCMLFACWSKGGRIIESFKCTASKRE